MQYVRRQSGALPLLQHALLELWNKRDGRRLTVRAYQEIGELEGALQRRADATLKALSEAEQELCRRTFLRLTQPGEGTEDTKRRASMQELVSLSGASSAEEDIVQKLTNASLLTTEGDLSQKTAFVEVAHEALIRSRNCANGSMQTEQACERGPGLPKLLATGKTLDAIPPISIPAPVWPWLRNGRLRILVS
jgi:conflict system STAND superfamily ATPase